MLKLQQVMVHIYELIYYLARIKYVLCLVTFCDINLMRKLLFFLILLLELVEIVEIVEKHLNFNRFLNGEEKVFVGLVRELLVGAFHGIYLIFAGITCFFRNLY